MGQPYKKISSGDRIIDQVQDNVDLALSPLIFKPWVADSFLLENISLVSGSVNRVPHRLGRKAAGYIVVLKSADCRIWDSNSSPSQTEQAKRDFLLLNTSANVTVNIVVW